jgi:surface protein
MLILLFRIPANYTIYLPIFDFKNIRVDWGDDTTTNDISHTYTNPGTHTVTINVESDGYVHTLFTTYNTTLIQCTSFGTVGLTKVAFNGSTHLTTVPTHIPPSITDMSFMFYNCSLNSDISKWDVSNVTNMNYMFGYAKLNCDISNWNVKNADVSDMFHASSF